jgi:DNA-binding transcriptional regulator GbsR (MarR family)
MGKMKKARIHLLSNEAKILSLLYYNELTRTELAKATGLAYTGVSYIILKLETLGLIKKVGIKKVKSGPFEDVYGITDKGIFALKKMLHEESLYLNILLDVKETVVVPKTG